MKRRALVILALIVLVGVVAMPGSALASGPRPAGIVGAVRFTMELYSPYPTIIWAPAWLTILAAEVEPWVDAEGRLHSARGRLRLRVYDENSGWLTVQNEISCIQFGADAGGRFALVTSEVVQTSDAPLLGNVWVHKLYDNGMPGKDGDVFSYYAGDAFPGWSFDPVCTVPDAYQGGLYYSYPVESGNFVIRE